MTIDPKAKSYAPINQKGSSDKSATDVINTNAHGLDKKIKADPKAAISGSVTKSTAVKNRKSLSSAVPNKYEAFVSNRESTKGSDYQQRKVTTHRDTSVSVAAGNHTTSSSLSNNEMKNRINRLATMSLKNTEPAALPTSDNMLRMNKKIKTDPKAVIPGVAAESVMAVEVYKGNKYQRKIASSRVSSSASCNRGIPTFINNLARNVVNNSDKIMTAKISNKKPSSPATQNEN